MICASSDDRFELLRDAIGSARRQEVAAREVIVVIDHNPSLLMRARAAFPAVRVLSNEETKGLPGARNAGAFAAQGALVAFLDDDAAAAPDWIKELHAALIGAGCLGRRRSRHTKWPNDKRPP